MFEFRDGDRVRYSPRGKYSYTHLAGKTGTVKFTDLEAEWAYVVFDFSPQYGTLPCAAEELEKVEV